jgi:hypothetical protein
MREVANAYLIFFHHRGHGGNTERGIRGIDLRIGLSSQYHKDDIIFLYFETLISLPNLRGVAPGLYSSVKP